MKNEKDDRVKILEREVKVGILEDDNTYILGIEIPGKGKLNIKLTFEKES